MRMIGRALRRIMRSTGGARETRVRPWIGVLLLAALTLGAAAPPAPRVCKLRGEIVLPDVNVAAAASAAPAVAAAHEHRDAAGGASDPAVVSNCASVLTALPSAVVPTSLPDGAPGGAADHLASFAASHDPPPPFHPPRLS